MDFSVRRGKNIIDNERRGVISVRYKRITRAVNEKFWNSSSDSAHSMYVGSYGRGTAINTSDLDVLVELPEYEFRKYDSTAYNGQSRLLQVVKNAVLDTYPLTEVRGDGQVVVVRFSDGIVFEILPAFKQECLWGRAIYKYPDTHMGGRWLSTNPKEEQIAIRNKDLESNGLLIETCKQIRRVRDICFSDRHLSGILIDSFVFEHIGGWHFGEGGVSNYWGTYEEHLLNSYRSVSSKLFIPRICAPGSGDIIDPSSSWETLGKVLERMV